MNDDPARPSGGDLRDTLDYVPRAEAIEDETIQAEALDEVTGQRRRGGGLGTVAVGLGVGCLLVVLVCGGVIAFGLYKFQQLATQTFVTDPEQVRQRTTELADIEIPETFKPALATQLPDFVTEQTDIDEPFRWVVYTREEGRGVLALGFFAADDDDADTQIEPLKEFVAQLGESIENIDITAEETREVMVGDEVAEFVFARGTVQPSGSEFRQVVGHFQGSRGRTWLFIQTEADAYDEAEIDAILESLK